MSKKGYLYILASSKRGTIYIGVTSNLEQRIHQHSFHHHPGFTSKYNVTILVHIEEFPRIIDAIAREKQLKQWRRAWKIALIEENNPQWEELGQ